MTDNVVRVRMELTYLDVVRLIHMQIHRLVGNGITYNQEQALSDANLAYVKAYHNFLPEKAKFTTHIGFRVSMAIISELKKLGKRQRTLTFSELDETGKNQIQEKLSVKPQPIEKGLPNWTDSLSEDAKMVVKLSLDPPRDITCLMEMRKTDRINSYRSCIKEHLGFLGWSKFKISKVFKEIGDAINA